jgi:hypothetical protein
VAKSFELTDEIRSVIGVETEPWTYEVTATGIRAFARGVGYTDPVFYDEATARKAGYQALPAPPCYLGTPVYVPGRSDPVFSVPPGTGPRPRFGLTSVLDGGTEIAYERVVLAGDVLTATEKVVSLDVKRSSGLGVMLLVTSEAEFRDPDGARVATLRSQVIFY